MAPAALGQASLSWLRCAVTVAALVAGCGSSVSSRGRPDASARGDGSVAGDAAEDGASPEDAVAYVVPDAIPIFVDPFNGEVGCDAAYRGAFECAGETLLHGGLDEAFYPESCVGTAGSPSIRFTGPVRGGAELEIVVTFASGVVPGQVGVQPPATFAITSTGGEGDAGTASWMTPTGACSITLDSNVCLPGVKAGNYGISGTGSCSQLAAPAAGNRDSAGPVEIVGFSFSAYLAAGGPDAG